MCINILIHFIKLVKRRSFMIYIFYTLCFLFFFISLYFLFQANTNHEEYWYLILSNLIFHVGYLLFYYIFSNFYFAFFSIFFCFFFTFLLMRHIKKEIPKKLFLGIPYFIYQFYLVFSLFFQLIQSI